MQAGYPHASHGRLTKEQQEAEDMRLAMQLQEEEERAARAATNGPANGTAHTSRPPAVAARPVAATPATSAQHAQRASTTADDDYQMALRLAGDTPQDYSTAGRTAATTQQPPRRPPAPAATATAVPAERKLTREEQEAEDHRLAMELQALEERGAGAPPGTAASAHVSQPPRAAPQSSHPDVVAVSSAGAVPALHEASPSTGSRIDLFSTVHRPGDASPAKAVSAPTAVAPPPKKDIMDDLFSTPAPTNAAAARQPPPASAGAFDPFAPTPAPAATSAPRAQPQQGGNANDFDFFAAAPSGPQHGHQPPHQHQQPGASAKPPTATTEHDLMDDLFSAAPAGHGTQHQRPPGNGLGADGMSQLDNFAAGRGNRAW